jgi:hypothetical protein
MSSVNNAQTRALIVDACAGQYQKGMELPLPFPAGVPAGYLHPDHKPSFGALEVIEGSSNLSLQTLS